MVDRDIFKQKVEVKPVKDYPIDAVYGKKLKAPEDLDDVRSLVISDYQEELEKEWVKELRKKISGNSQSRNIDYGKQALILK